MSIESKVGSFLKELKELIRIWDVFFVNRPKNSAQHLADLGITANKRTEIITSLEVVDYSEGPLEETQFNGTEMWVFGKVIKKNEIYIKLTISKDTSKSKDTIKVICISFHKAEHPMNYPLKK